MQHKTLAWTFACSFGLLACDVQDPSQVEVDGTTTDESSTDESSTDAYGGLEGMTPDSSDKVDLLFIVDNSGSMAGEQSSLTRALEQISPWIESDSNVDWRIAVTTTEGPNLWCPERPPMDQGSFVMSSCLTRLADFTAEDLNGVLDARMTCASVCDLAAFDVLPTAIDADADVHERPWLEFGPMHANVDTDLGSVFRCMMPMGISGCGFEQPLESLHAALELSLDERASGNFGFIREDAHLVVVFVTDEADCSYNPDHESLFLPLTQAGSRRAVVEAFWPDPQALLPNSAVCWNAGVACEPNPTGTLDCRAEDFAFDGRPTDDPDAAMLYPLDRYRAQLETLRETKAPFGATVALFGILGVPIEFPATNIVYAVGEEPFQSDFGIGPGCSAEDESVAVPPVRIKELVGQFGSIEERLFSICDDGYDLAIANIFEPWSP